MPHVPTRPLPNPAATSRHLSALSEIARLATADLALRPMLQRIADELHNRFPWDLVELIRIDRERGVFVCEAFACALPTELKVGYSRRLGTGVVGRVAESGQAMVVDDANEIDWFVHMLDGVRSEICVPVEHRGEIVALLNAESQRVGTFHGQLPLVSAIADQIAGAIACARLYEETKSREEALAVLSRVSRLATEGGEIGQRLEAIAHYLRQRFALPLVAILVSDPENRQWRHQAVAYENGETTLPSNWPIGAGVVGRAVATGRRELVLDVASDPDYLEARPDVRAELVIPVRLSDGTRAALNFETRHPETFDCATVELMQSLGNQIAGAIALSVANQRLEESQSELEKANRRLAAANERLEEANQSLVRMTRVDGLTGVGNRTSFDERLDEEWRRAFRSREPLAVALVDIDHFKAYNDTYGHQQGDDALRLVAKVMSEGLERAGELVARFGGDELAAILPRSTADAAMRSVDAVRRAVAAAALDHESSDVAPHLTVSAGVASIVPSDDSTPAKLVAAADGALYQAKRGGRNCVCAK